MVTGGHGNQRVRAVDSSFLQKTKDAAISVVSRAIFPGIAQQRTNCHLLASCWIQEDSTAHTIPVEMNGEDTEALVDSSSLVSLVQPHLLGLTKPGLLPVSCVHGDTRDYPTGIIKLITVKGSCMLEVGVVGLY